MSPAMKVEDRFNRLMAIVTWLTQEGEATIDEAAANFDLSPGELVAELELAACCGTPPYTPDQLLEIIVTDDSVVVRPGTALGRPRRLSAPEGLALAAAAHSVLAVPGSDEAGDLARAVAKLDAAINLRPLQVDLDEPEYLGLLRQAKEEHLKVELLYYSASTDTERRRTVAPGELFAAEGHWYLNAWCEEVGGERRFRVDRILEATIGEPFEMDQYPWAERSEEVPRYAFAPGPESRLIRILADPQQEWIFEAIPSARRVGEEDGRPVWEVQVGGDAWLERLLLRLGPETRVLAPPAVAGLAAQAAQRILERYRD